jgi:uncharacterized protein YuzE
MKHKKLQYYYDSDADVFYFSQGKPSARDEVIEAGDDVLLRISPRTRAIRGFTLLNASHRERALSKGAPLPFSLALK